MIRAVARDDVWDLHEAYALSLFKLAAVLVGQAATAEDIVQEAFIAYMRAAPRPETGKELAYLRRTVINLAHGHHRRLGRLRRLRFDPPTDHPSAETEAARSERRRQVVDAVRQLPSRQRDVVVLHYFTELADSEIADVLGISVGSVKTHLHRARTTLAKRLEGSR
jgi:RNA polymerase sigma factor (sigma-70 family)